MYAARITPTLRRVLPRVCVGGTQWTATGTTGNGISGPVAATTPRQVTAYVVAATQTDSAATLPQTLVGDATWVVYSWDELVPGETLTNADGWQFTVGARVDVPYPLWIAEEGR